MKKFITIILATTFIFSHAFAQVKEVEPSMVSPLCFTAKKKKVFDKKMAASKILVEKSNNEGLKYEDLPKEKQELFNFYIEVDTNYYAASDYENIWAACASPQNITTSSSYSSKKYKVTNLYDFDFSTAWATKGEGIGERITYHFNACTPRISAIFIANGDVKSQSLWGKSRKVKKMMLRINDEPYAVLLLDNSRSEQVFSFPPIGNNCQNNREEAKDWTLTFEILETYSNTKKQNYTTISEIYFDGNADVRCFVKGTLVTMADGSTKPIEELTVGEEVKAYDFENFQPTAAVIEKLEQATHQHLVKYTFSNGKEIVATPDHPFMVRAKGWSSMKPEQTKQYKGYESVNEIKVGDGFFMINSGETISTITLTKIEELDEKQETYTISKLSAGNNFLVEGFIVGTEDIIE